MEEEARVLIRTKMERFLAHMNSNKKSLFTAEYQAVRIALPQQRTGTSRLTPQSVAHVRRVVLVESGGTTRREIAPSHQSIRPCGQAFVCYHFISPTTHKTLYRMKSCGTNGPPPIRLHTPTIIIIIY
jgi:hypothetical protein